MDLRANGEQVAAYNQATKSGNTPWMVAFMSTTNGNNGSGVNGDGHNLAPQPGPLPRAEWLAQRKNGNTDGNFSQMHYARRGQVTEEMTYVAQKEKIAPELIRDEVARGRMIIHANIDHPRGRSDSVCAFGFKAHHRHRQPRRSDSSAVDDASSQAKFPLRAL